MPEPLWGNLCHACADLLHVPCDSRSCAHRWHKHCQCDSAFPAKGHRSGPPGRPTLPSLKHNELLVPNRHNTALNL
eukprot:scaffold4710_cov20-Prasinocladus_malaysianus.AAC.1